MNELEIHRRAFRALLETDLEGALRATLEAMVEVAKADRGFVVHRRGPGSEPSAILATVARPGAFPGDKPSETIVRRVLETGKPVRIENALEELSLRDRTSIVELSVHSILAVPIVLDGATLAVFYLDSVRLSGIFGEDAEASVVQLAATVAPTIRHLVLLAEARERERALLERLEGTRGARLVGRSPVFVAALERALKAAASEAPVLLEGESGTGKELFARAIHAASLRAKGPFVAINCGALPESTLEAELFGYRKGAFTGATEDRTGRVEAAHEGTLFLDEIGDMPSSLQVKLLRVLQEGEIQKLGDPKERRVSIRVVAATHRDLRALVADGCFREDLLYRLRVVPVAIPPLRERGDDVLLLAQTIVTRLAREQERPITGLAASAREALLGHAFPGNVRELENALRHAVIFAPGPRVTAADLPVEIGAKATGSTVEKVPVPVPRDGEELRAARERAVARVERRFLRSLLRRAGGNVARAARLAGMNRSVLHELLARNEVSAASVKRAKRRRKKRAAREGGA